MAVSLHPLLESGTLPKESPGFSGGTRALARSDLRVVNPP